MRCPNCGNENPDDYTFCDECGARLTPAEGENTDSAEATASGASPEPAYAQSGSAVGQGYQPMAADAQATGTGGPDAPSQPLSPAGAGMDAPTGAVCPSCGAPTVPGEAYCSECGAELPAGGSTYEGGPLPEPDQGVYAPSANGSAPAGAPVGAPAAAQQSVPDGRSREVPPPTEDTTGAAPLDQGAQVPMPGVVSLPVEDQNAASVPVTSDDTVQTQPAAPAAAQDVTQAATSAPTPAPGGAAVAGAGGGAGAYEWAHQALAQLEDAQQAMARGDFMAYGQSMSVLKTFLQSVAQGAASSAGASAVPAAVASSTAPAAPAADFTSAPPAATVPPLVPIGQPAESGELSAAPPPQQSVPGQARLVVISSGAELPLPQQEEITVGREDPSSGIFPDVDLTPYGGEDGGVSRRHARLLHVAGDYFVEDLQSTNYTKVDGQRLPARVREKLEDGARLDFGRVAVIFRRS